MSTFILVGIPLNIHAQWKPMLQDATGFTSIYFLDLPGSPRIGFAGSRLKWIYKTTDGGSTWKVVIPTGSISPYAINDFAFKDSLHGWMAGGQGGCYETIDGGDSWSLLTASECWATGVHFDSISHLLILASWMGPHLFSSDEGATWSTLSNIAPGSYLNGFAYATKDLGIVSKGFSDTWNRTTDGGTTWSTVSMDSECWQPLAIAGTLTQFAISDYNAKVYRTDDLWDTRTELFSFPLDPDPVGYSSTGCIRGTLCHLFVQRWSGCYMSNDEGLNWRYLSGPRFGPKEEIYDRRFYVKDNFVYMATHDSIGGTLWLLDLDSLETPHIGIAEQFSDGTKRTVIHEINRMNRDVTVNFVPGAGTMTAVDSIKLALRYDPNVFDSLSFSLPIGWWIADSVSHDGVLDLVLRDSIASPLPNPLLRVTFKASLATSKTFIYLDSAISYLPHTACDFSTLSLAAPDSVEIDFEGCGDSTLLRFMATGSPFEIESVTPNPARDEISVHLSRSSEAPVTYTLFDALGVEKVIGRSAGGPVNGTRGGDMISFEVLALPSGDYYLRFSQLGYVRTRKVVIER